MIYVLQLPSPEKSHYTNYLLAVLQRQKRKTFFPGKLIQNVKFSLFCK